MTSLSLHALSLIAQAFLTGHTHRVAGPSIINISHDQHLDKTWLYADPEAILELSKTGVSNAIHPGGGALKVESG